MCVGGGEAIPGVWEGIWGGEGGYWVGKVVGKLQSSLIVLQMCNYLYCIGGFFVGAISVIFSY